MTPMMALFFGVSVFVALAVGIYIGWTDGWEARGRYERARTNVVSVYWGAHGPRLDS